MTTRLSGWPFRDTREGYQTRIRFLFLSGTDQIPYPYFEVSFVDIQNGTFAGLVALSIPARASSLTQFARGKARRGRHKAKASGRRSEFTNASATTVYSGKAVRTWLGCGFR